jgi:hypothetical protein
MADPPRRTYDPYAITPAVDPATNTQAARVTRRARSAAEFGRPPAYDERSLPDRRPQSWQTPSQTS